MNAINYKLAFIFKSPNYTSIRLKSRFCLSPPSSNATSGRFRKLGVKKSKQQWRREEYGKAKFLIARRGRLVEISSLSSHERFLCRLTISSLNLLRVISELNAGAIEELNAGKVCDWFIKDKLKREPSLESAVLQSWAELKGSYRVPGPGRFSF